MTRKSWPVLALLSTAALVCGPVLAQAQKAESLDDLSEDNDLIQQIDSYAFTVDQLKAIVPVLQPIEQKRAALAAFKESEEALRPLRAVREALLKGAATDELQKAADDVWQKAQKLEAEVDEAIPEAMKRIADLLTEEQLATLTQGSDAAATLADGLFSDLDNASGLDDAGFAKWRDDKAHEVAVQAAGEEEQKVGAIEGGLKQFQQGPPAEQRRLCGAVGCALR